MIDKLVVWRDQAFVLGVSGLPTAFSLAGWARQGTFVLRAVGGGRTRRVGGILPELGLELSDLRLELCDVRGEVCGKRFELAQVNLNRDRQRSEEFLRGIPVEFELLTNGLRRFFSNVSGIPGLRPS